MQVGGPVFPLACTLFPQAHARLGFGLSLCTTTCMVRGHDLLPYACAPTVSCLTSWLNSTHTCSAPIFFPWFSPASPVNMHQSCVFWPSHVTLQRSSGQHALFPCCSTLNTSRAGLSPAKDQLAWPPSSSHLQSRFSTPTKLLSTQLACTDHLQPLYKSRMPRATPRLC